MFRLKTIVLFLFVLLGTVMVSQSFIPTVTQFSKKVFKAGSQNWSVCQGNDGLMYFGNNDGLICYDGWIFDLITLPHNRAVRSIYIDSQDRIFVGAFEEFGFFERNQFGEYVYTSLSALLNDYDMKNDEIWHILEYDGKIIFQSFTSIFVWDEKEITGTRYDFTFLYLSNFQNRLFVFVHEYGFCEYDTENKDFNRIKDVPFNSPVIKLIPVNDEYSYIVTESDGIFTFDGKIISKFNTDAEKCLSEWIVNKAVFTKDSLLVIGTIQKGVLAFNRDGKKMWELNTTNILQNNTVLGMCCDMENNVWLALDRGISIINLSNSLQFVYSFSPYIGSVYSVAYQAPNIYLATNLGLYSARLSLDEKKIYDLHYNHQILGQTWNVFQADKQLFCGNNGKTVEIYSDGKTGTVTDSKGGMCMFQGKIHDHDVLVQGTYNEICVYLRKNDRWVYSHSIDDFFNPIKTIGIDVQGNIWASHMHKGLYKLTLKEDLKTIDKIEIFNSLDGSKELPIKVYIINNHVVFSDNNSLYLYDDFQDKIIPYDDLNESLGVYNKSYNICYYKQNTYWFIRNEGAVLVQIKANDIQILDRIHFSALQNRTVDKSECIIPISSDYSIITLENGLGLYSAEKRSFRYNMPQIALERVEIFEDNSLQKHFLSLSDDNKIKIPHNQNNIAFTVCFPCFSDVDYISFRYKLEGLSDKWGLLTSQNSKQYEYLSSGNYVFYVEACTDEGEVVGRLDYHFFVKPPILWSLGFRILYISILILMLYLMYKRIKKKYALKEKKMLEEQEKLKKKEIKKREKKIYALEKEKLESELSLKSKELAASTMNLIKKNELLNNIKVDITDLKEKLGSQYPNKYYNRLIRMLDENISSEDDWSVFQENFDCIHENFFRNLHKEYPDLTSNDLRFCAYLRLNLPTKDIARLMNISPKGVEAGRYRIRKKVGIPSSKSLTEFMIEFK